MSGLAASWSSQCQVAELVQHLSVSWLISSEDSEMETGKTVMKMLMTMLLTLLGSGMRTPECSVRVSWIS